MQWRTPAVAWDTATPESQGMSTQLLNRLRDSLAARRTRALLVVRHGRVVYERYAPGFGPTQTHYTASLAKALVGGTSLLLALSDGRIALDSPASHYIPAWKRDSLKASITIRYLATHTSGLEDAEESGRSHTDLDGWKGMFLRRTTRSVHACPHPRPSDLAARRQYPLQQPRLRRPRLCRHGEPPRQRDA